MTQQPAIELRGLSKEFKDIKAVDNVTFSVQPGQIFGYMGHNGAGKTTSIKMLLGLLRPTGGAASVMGYDVVQQSLDVRRVCGFLPASFSLPKEMTPTTFLRYIASMFAMDSNHANQRIRELLALFELEDVADKKLGGFSTGMMQKVGLAQALLNEPQVIFLDEPTSGLDPLNRHNFLSHIRQLSVEKGVTVLFSTHILSDIESICEQVAVIHRGRLIAEGSLQALKAQHGQNNMDDLYLKLVQEAS
jgi:ABC-2 type transport system ATP-binding protein